MRRAHVPPGGAVIELVAFDGDDTLWHNESIFSMTQQRFSDLMEPYVADDDLSERLFATEMRNLRLFGYGVKSFTLSMIETAIELSDAKISAEEIAAIIHAGRSMLQHPVELLDGVEDAIERVSEHCAVMLITKGDLFDQESKLARSGLGDRFEAVEIVAEKDETAYRRILSRRGIAPDRFVMVGNSGRSDILPTLALGAWAVHVPYPLTWAHERIDESALDANERYRRISSLAELPAIIADLAARAG
jgi:putative hydrolase of the HAD superfamily